MGNKTCAADSTKGERMRKRFEVVEKVDVISNMIAVSIVIP